jgi:hypothetical protein
VSSPVQWNHIMKQGALNGLVVSSVGLLLTLGFACVGADIPNVSNDLRDSLAENFSNPGAAPVGASGDGGSASTPSAGAGGNGGAADDADAPATPDPEANGGAAGSSMASGSMAGGIAGSGMAGGAGADSEDGAEGAPATSCDGFAVLQTYCATSGCHGMPNAPLGDFASSEDAAREFVGVQGRISCAGQGAIIDTDDPEASVLVAKMSDDPPCGIQMPPTGAPLTDEDVACVVDWIGGL